MQTIKIKQATKTGYIEMISGGICDLSYVTSKTRRGRVQGKGMVCPTIMADQSELCKVDRIEEEPKYKIRKLTPVECYRMQGVDEHDIKAMMNVESDTRCYEASGNSIAVPVLMGIFSQLNIKGIKPWNDMSDDERYELIYRGCYINENPDIVDLETFMNGLTDEEKEKLNESKTD